MSNVNMIHDQLYSESIPIAAKTDATENGTADRLVDGEAVELVVMVGTFTDGVHTFKLQEAPDDGAGSPGTFADVAAAHVVTRTDDAAISGATVVVDGAADDNAVHLLGYIKHGTSEHLRAVLTTTGSTTGAVCGAFIRQYGLRYSGKSYVAADTA